MSHPAHEALWAFARHELHGDEAAAVAAHVELCAACQDTVADARAAAQLLAVLPEPPPLPQDVARRVGTRLDEAFLAQPRRSTLADFFERLGGLRWVLLAGAAAMVAGLVLLLEPTPPPDVPVAKRDVPAVPGPAVTPPPGPTAVPAPPRPPGPRLVARVATARKAKAGTAAVAAKQELAAGAAVTTEQGGSLWMQLPDGTRAGLTGATEVQLAALEPKALTLEVKSGNLAMLVPHREDRVLTVKAGDVSVKDLGTRFVVSRELGHVLVAVEEGRVEVAVPGRTETLEAGHAAEYHDGALRLLPWTPPARTAAPTGTGTAATPATPEVPAGTPDVPTPSVARLEEEDVAPPQEPEQAAALPAAAVPEREPPVEPEPGQVRAPQNNERPDETWARPPTGTAVAPTPPGPGAPPHHVETATPRPPAPVRATEPLFSLKGLEQQLQQVKRQLAAPFPSLDSTARQTQARAIAKLADEGDCQGALAASDTWLAGSPAVITAEELPLRRSVLTQRVRCFTKLGRAAEAAQAKAELAALQ